MKTLRNTRLDIAKKAEVDLSGEWKTSDWWRQWSSNGDRWVDFPM